MIFKTSCFQGWVVGAVFISSVIATDTSWPQGHPLTPGDFDKASRAMENSQTVLQTHKPVPITGILPGDMIGSALGTGSSAYLLENGWREVVNGQPITVYAGSMRFDPRNDTVVFDPMTVQGFVLIQKGETGKVGSTMKQVNTPTSVGSLHIVSVNGTTLTLQSRQGKRFSLDAATEQLVALTDNRPPIAKAGAKQIVECTGTNGSSVTLDGTGSSDPDGDPLSYTWTGSFTTATGPTPTISLPLGTYSVRLTVDDGHGATASDIVTVQIVDTKPPVIASITANPNSLWPPNHKLVPVKVVVSANDVCGGTAACNIVSVTSNEPSDGTTPDWNITGNLSVNLRAERLGNGTGRIYSIAVQCKDASGNSLTKTVDVSVPHNQ